MASLKPYKQREKCLNPHKELTKLSLDVARQYQSKETGFVHYSFLSENSKETVPLFENFCFSLALFRTHLSEQVLEGKALLTRLLYFQSPQGGFPEFIHEYPFINRPFHNLQFLFPLYQIWFHYRKILGEELTQRLIASIELLSQYLDTLPLQDLQIYQKKAFDHVFFGSERPDPVNPILDKDLGKAILAAQLLDDEVQIPWDRCFLGPPFKEWQKEFQPQLIHLDLLLRPKIDSLDPILIHASLFYPTQIKIIHPTQVTSKDYTWQCLRNDHFHLLAIDSFKPTETILSNGFHLLKLIFKDHTFVCQETKHTVTSQVRDDGLQMDFTFPIERPTEKYKQMELNFYLNHEPKIDLLIHAAKATTFAIEDPLTFDRFTLTFSIQEGEADLFGHIYRGNRPSQISPKVKADYAAFDWKISLRTISRTEHLKLRATISW